MKKQVLVLASILTVGGTAVGLGINSFASAASNQPANQQTNGQTGTKHPDGDWRHDHRQMLVARLNQAERDGVITSSQLQAFKTELKTLNTERKTDLNKSSTMAERQGERAKLKSELQAWASSNNFPLSKIFPRMAS